MFKYEAEKRYDQTLHWIARHLPRRLLMWCFIHVAAHATKVYPNQHPDTINLIGALEAWRREVPA